MTSEFRKLAAYRLSAALANEMHQVVARWPSFERWSVGLQLIRALDSVGANIAEAAGRWSHKDRRRLLIVARGSLYEAEHWIATAEERTLLERGTTEHLTEIAKALSGLIKRPAPN